MSCRVCILGNQRCDCILGRHISAGFDVASVAGNSGADAAERSSERAVEAHLEHWVQTCITSPHWSPPFSFFTAVFGALATLKLAQNSYPSGSQSSVRSVNVPLVLCCCLTSSSVTVFPLIIAKPLTINSPFEVVGMQS